MLVAVRTPDEITEEVDKESQKQRDDQASIDDLKTAVTSQMAGYVRKCWDLAKQDRHQIHQRLLDCLRRRKGEYDPVKLQAIKDMGGSDIFMMITGAKCRNAKAWLADLFAPAGDKPFTLDPSPIPDLPPDISTKLIVTAIQGAQEMGLPQEAIMELMEQHQDRLLDELKQDAEERAERMETAIEDLMLDGGWRDQFDEFLEDLVTYPAAILKGLEFKKAKTLEWVNENGKFVPMPGHKIKGTFRRVSPFRYYPSPNAGSDIQDDWGIEHITFKRYELAEIKESPGFITQSVEHVLSEYSSGGLREWMWSDAERAELEGRSFFDRGEDIDALEFNGRISGHRMKEWGMEGSNIDANEEYSVVVTIIGNEVIRALVNPDPAGESDYFKACWQSVPDSFWGTALPETIADCQDQCNAAGRALTNNMGFASGPMVWVEGDRLANGENPREMYPWKVWVSNEASQGSSPGVGFFQPQSNANEMLMIYERYSRYADELSGIPAYMQGSDSNAGASKTASGLGMLMNAASKNIKAVVRNIDIHVIERVVRKVYNHLMLYSDDESIKGDLRPKARGSESLVHKEQQAIQAQNLLAMTGNELDMQIIGAEGRREILHETVKASGLPVDRIVPSKEKMREQEEQQAEQMMMQQQMAQQIPQEAAGVPA